MSSLNVAIYGDVDLNLIDGSAIWLQSIVDVAADVDDTNITLLLKAPVREHRLLGPLEGRDNIRIVRPFEEQRLPDLSRALSPHQVATILAELDRDDHFDAVIVRGRRVATRLANEPRFRGRLWPYLTDVPQSALAMSQADRSELETITESAAVILCQTEDLRTHFESLVSSASAKTAMWPPVVASIGDDSSMGTVPALEHRALRLVYSGKMAMAWNTLEMTDLPAALSATGIPTELHVIGDKIHDEREDPTFASNMRAALERPGVVWHGGVSRAEAMRLASTADIGMSWRSASLDDSLELSTKVLEFGAMGRPVVLNRTPAHEQLVGADYPLFAATSEDVIASIRDVVRDETLFALAAERCHVAAQPFSRAMALRRLTALFDRVRPAYISSTPGRTLRLLIASHDFKFIDRLLTEWQRVPGIELRVDHWPAMAEHDPAVSADLNDWADVVVCEWCGPNAIWYSQHKRPGSRLIVRLHRFELYSQYPDRLALDGVDVIVTVNNHYQELVRERLPEFPPSQVVSIPNWVDCESLRRPKLKGTRFQLGMIGIAPRRKRFDLALDVLSEVRRVDGRYSLHVKTKPPWDYWWIWKDPAEQAHYRAAFERIETDRSLQGSVVLDPFGPDVGSWLRKIGCVLSTSDDESFHLAPAEGMASGAPAVVFPWPGADTVYSQDWTVSDVGEAVDRVLELADPVHWDKLSAAALAEVTQYDLPVVTQMWVELLTRSALR